MNRHTFEQGWNIWAEKFRKEGAENAHVEFAKFAFYIGAFSYLYMLKKNPSKENVDLLTNEISEYAEKELGLGKL